MIPDPGMPDERLSADVTEALLQLDRAYYEMERMSTWLYGVAEQVDGRNPDLAHGLRYWAVWCQGHADLLTDDRVADLLLESLSWLRGEDPNGKLSSGHS